jgi:hypothetical protein
MNHDFQFFFNVMPHPEVQRFFEHVKDWLHQRMNMRDEREAGLVRRQSLAGLHDEHHPDHAADSDARAHAHAEVVDAGHHEEKKEHHRHHHHHHHKHEEEVDVPPPAPVVKEAEPASAKLIDEQMSKRPTTEEPTYHHHHHHPNEESLPGLAVVVDDDAVAAAVASATATRRLSAGEGEVKVTVLAGKPTGVIDDDAGMYARFDDEEADDLMGVYAMRTPPYPV